MHGSTISPDDRLAAGRFSDWPLAVKSILAFWAVYALTVAVRAFMSADPATVFTNRLIIIGIGIVLTGLVYIAIAAFAAGSSIRRKAVIARQGRLQPRLRSPESCLASRTSSASPRRSSATRREKAS
jgi:hypothetical protein